MATSTKILKPSRSRRWSRRLNRWFIAVAALVILSDLVWIQVASRRLKGEIARLQAAGEPMTFDALPIPHLPDSQNASLDYLAAGKLIDQKSAAFQAWYQSDSDSGQFTLPLTANELATFRTILSENQSALAAVAAARGKPAGGWGDHFVPPDLSSTSLPDYVGARAAANLMRIAAFVAHADGHDEQALEHLNDLMRLADATQKRPMLVGHLVGLGINALACDTASRIACELQVGPKGADRAAAEQLIGQLQNEQLLAEGRRLGWRSERIFVLGTFDGEMTGKIGQPDKSAPDQSHVPSFERYMARPLFLDDTRMMLIHMQGILEASEAADWPTAQHRFPTELPRAIEAHPQMHLLSSLLILALDREMQQDYQSMAVRRLAAAALGVRLFAIDHQGALPPTLDALMPTYLPAMPIDPYSGRPIRYLPDGKKPVIYSIGPDGIDDGGVAQDLSRGVTRDGLKGDIVVNLKLQPRKSESGNPTTGSAS